MSKKIGIIVGSLRKGSYTRSIAEAIKELFPADYTVEDVEIGHLPIFNQQYDDEDDVPQSYADFRTLIESYDGFVFATPEHNRSYTAVMKNALDVASRPYGENKWDSKPAVIVSVSPGLIGGFGANHHLRQMMTFLNMQPVQQPEAYISNVKDLLDGNGKLANADTRVFLQTVVDALIEKL